MLQSLQSEGVQAYLEQTRFRKPIFMVTGLKIAHCRSWKTLDHRSIDPRDDRGALVVGSSNFTFAFLLRNINIKREEFKKWQLENPPADKNPLLKGRYRVDENQAKLGHEPIKERKSPDEGNGKGESDSEEPTGSIVEPTEITAPSETRPPRILCFDGGGVRGISSLCVLKEIMKEVETHANSSGLKPCDYFDFICGTCTSGLIALILGRL